jgi:hypothetical protein
LTDWDYLQNATAGEGHGKLFFDTKQEINFVEQNIDIFSDILKIKQKLPVQNY